jgi:uncharacterized protein (TIGR03437 family)
MTFRTAALVAILSAVAVPGIAENAVKKTPYFRPKGAQSKEQRLDTRPRASSGPVVVNAASYLAGVCQGGLATIFGENLTTVSGIVFAGTDPLPTHLAGVAILVNGIPAPIFGIAYSNGEDQISFQVPYEIPTGPAAADIVVFDFGQQVASIIADSFTEDPGIFTYAGGYAVATSAVDYSLIGPNNPTFPGEELVLYTTGLGPLNLLLTDGFGAPSDPLAYTVDPLEVLVDNEQCRVDFSGLAPGFVGLYQINFRVPLDAPHGNLTLQIQTPFVSSGIATLPVQ